MAIDTGLGVTCADLQATGGIKQILLRSWATGDVVNYGAAGTHSIVSILETAADANWFVYEFKNETPALTINATKENGSTALSVVYLLCYQKWMLQNLVSYKAY